MPDPLRRVAAAHASIGQLRRLMFDDLDEVRGGFRWWYGHMDQPKVIFASDYLLQITGQIGTWLTLAARHEIDFNEAWYAETTWLRQNEGKGIDPFARRGELEQRRDQRINAAIVGFFHACGSTLDTVAGAAVGVLSLRADLVKASWSDLESAASWEEKKRIRALAAVGPEARAKQIEEDKKRSRLLAADGTEARAMQTEAVAAICRAVDQGPRGWLSWTLSMRHALVHRAHRLELRQFHHVSRRSPLEYVLHLARDPQLTDAEAFVLAGDPKDLLLWEHAGTTMAGVLDHLLAVVSTTADQLRAVWQRRCTQPDLVLQAGEQWRDLYPTKRELSRFAGFGQQVGPLDGQWRLDPDSVRRLRAARVMDSDRPYWWTTFANGG